MPETIDLTSSDEEDNVPSGSKFSVSSVARPAAVQANGAAKKPIASHGSNGAGRVVASMAGAGEKVPSVPSSSVDWNGGPAVEKGPSQNGGSAPLPVWKGMEMGKNGATRVAPVEEVRTSAGVSGWGDPLPPEPLVVHTPQDDSLRVRPNGMASATNVHVANNSHGADDLKKESVCVGTVGDVEWKEPITGQVGKGSLASPLPTEAAPAAPALDDSGVCRQFWKAGEYELKKTGVRSASGPMDHVRVHPKFLHSNATSHKWALGAVAELLDNAVDEIQNGATFVSVDKIVNPRDGSPALLVQDDGGGMTPDNIRACMSLGYSRKNTNTTIGQYGNGFKTSTMRLGADVVVLSRNKQGSTVTQSIGLLSYTFLRKTGREDVVVPMIDYEVTPGEPLKPRTIIRTSHDDWLSNLATLAEWSPYRSEAELLAQFDDLGWHGTKVIVYNLWYNDDGLLELDFDSDELDIQLRGGPKLDKNKPVSQQLTQQHIASRYHHSLRVYTSILYLRMPQGFQVILRGTPVEHHQITQDLKFPESIVYKPQIGEDKTSTASVITFIGFTKEAPLVSVHGFNVYHKNRLIMPFWKVWQDNSSRGRGVVGVLEANFVEPAHDKQDFERTAVLLRLETRLKQMTVEYWNLHCHLIGYQPNTKAGKAARSKAAAATGTIEYPSPIASITPGDVHQQPLNGHYTSGEEPGRVESLAPDGSRSSSANSDGPSVKAEPVEVPRNSSKRPSYGNGVSEPVESCKRQRTAPAAQATTAPREAGGTTETALVEQPRESEEMLFDLMEENTQLRSRCVDYELDVKKLAAKVMQLEKELLDSKMKNVNLQEQLQKYALQITGKQRQEVKLEQ